MKKKRKKNNLPDKNNAHKAMKEALKKIHL